MTRYEREKLERAGNAEPLTHEEWKAIKRHYRNRCAYCGERGELEQDHIIPLIHGGKTTASNIVPCCRKCNASKGMQPFDKWYKKQPFFNSKRLARIDVQILFKGETIKLGA